MTLAILCSGQGAQQATMFDLTARASAAAPIFAAASARLGHDIIEWVRQATPQAVQSNRAAQLLCCTQALAAWTALDLAAQREIVIAGYSVGELASWGCAGVLQPQDVLRLAEVRALAMDSVAGTGTGLIAVRGLGRGALTPLCERHGCEIAIVLSDDHYLVGGTLADLKALSQAAMPLGAQRVTSVPVGVASHTSRLTAASARFAAELAKTTVAAAVPAGVRLLSGIDGDRVVDVRAGIRKLAQQIAQTLDWQACLTACAEAGVTQVLELGPGRALAAMAREALPGARCRSLDEFRSLDGVRGWLDADR
jgi:[acyl-carrier-protein] S-malonyltransferase